MSEKPRERGAGVPTPPPARAHAGAARGLLAALGTPPVWLGLALVLASRLAFHHLIPTANEDAYITFRFARSFAEGLGPVFDPGERVMGYTSPLWMAWCALGLLVGHQGAEPLGPLLWVRITSLLADAVTLVALVALLERHASRTASWCLAALFGAWPFFAAVSVSGLESSLMLALLALAGWQVSERSAWAGVTLGALALTRPEGVLAALALAPWATGRARVSAAAIAALGFAALTAFHGSPLPQSALAKARVYGTPGPLASRHWWDWIVPVELGGWPAQGDTAFLWTLRLVVGPAALAGALALWRTRARALVVAGLVVWSLYIATGTAYFYWYLLVPAAMAAFLASAGVTRVTRGAWIPVAAACVVASAWSYQAHFYTTRAGNESGMFGRAANFLAANAKPGESALLEPIGIVGWVNPRLVLHDETGLVAPWIAERRTRGPGWYADALDHYQPDWLVVRWAFLRDARAFAGRGAPFRDSTEFARTLAPYRLEYATEPEPGDADLAVLRRTR